MEEAAKAEQLRHQIETMQEREALARANAQSMLRDALPVLEQSLQGATRELTQHAPRATTRRSEHSDATRQSERALGELRRVISRDADAAAMREASAALHETAGRVAHQVQQLHATLAAQSSGHNDGACLVLRVLAIDNVRRNVLGNLSFVLMHRIRRVCADFRLWSRAALLATGGVVPMTRTTVYAADFNRTVEVAHLPTLTCGSIAYPTDLKKIAREGQEFRGMAVARSPSGSIYLAGGEQNQIAHDDDSRAEMPDVRVWRPGPGPGGGRWEVLPPMPTAVSDARAVAVTMPEGDEALVVIGGPLDDDVDSDSDSDSGDVYDRSFNPRFQVLRRGSWSDLSPLPTHRKDFSLCALSGGGKYIL